MKYAQQDVDTSFTGTKTAVFTFMKGDVKVTIRLYTEPLETSYYNIDATVEINGACYLYNGSEREYNGMAEEISILDGIISHAMNHQYKFIKRKVFLFWTNTYMQIAFDGVDVELLRINARQSK